MTPPAEGVEGRVLVVDDDERIRGFLHGVLAAEGFHVVEACDGPEAFQRILDRPDVVILDVALPGMDGFEVCRRLKAHPESAAIPVVMLSGLYVETEDRARALEGHADGFLTKPVTTRELVATVRGMLRLRRAERQSEERGRAAEALRQRVAQARSMVEVARAITSSLDLPAVLDRIVDQARLLLTGDRFALAVLDAGRAARAIRFVAVRGLSPDFTELRPLHPLDGTAAAAVNERRPVWSADLLNDARFQLSASTRAIVEAEGCRAVLSVPLLAGDEPLGALVMFRDAPGPFAEDDVEILQLLAAQAAIAIQNAELYRRSEARAEKLEALSALTQLITSAASSREVFDAVAEAVTRLLEARAARVWVDDPEAGVLRVEGSYPAGPRASGPLDERSVIPHGSGPIATVFATRRPEYVADTGAGERWPDVRAFAGVPLLTAERVVGVLSVLFGAPREFTDEDRRLTRLLADHAAIAIGQAQLYATAERRRREAEVMAELARDVSASLVLDRVLQRVAQGAKELCGADATRIALCDASGAMRMRFGAGSRSDAWHGLAIEPGHGSGGQAMATRRPFRTTSYHDDPRITKTYASLAATEGTVAEMVVPILAQDELLGLLFVMNRSPRPFTDHDEAILLRLANHAAAALHNASLYQELREANETLERSQAQLVQIERLHAIGELASGVAHDFNNLLAVILGRAELLLARVQDANVVRGLAAIRRAAQDGANTVRRIQEFTRTRRSRPFDRVSLGDIVREVIDLTRPRWKDEAQSAGIGYDLIVTGEAPAVAGRPEELREVLTSLLQNALDAMPDGGRCEFRLSGEDAWALVSVTDTGVGMDEEVRRRVFEPFFTSKGPRGTGLGLAVSWRIVNRHGGTIEVLSTPGGGSTFVVRLPVEREVVAGPAVQGVPPRRASARILVIDDEPSVRAMLVDLLADAGYVVSQASGGVEGIGRCERQLPDVLLTDVSMPGLSGWDVAATCRQRFPSLPIGLVTGWGDQLDAGRLEQCGVTFVVAKPFEREQLLREVARALDRA
jgi:GAF domain-containing protein/FixJ family two-component response regulator